MSELIPMSDIRVMAAAIAKSNLFGVKTEEQAFALMLIAQAEGMHPAIAARDYHVIQGRPSLKADAMLARFQRAGGMVQWKIYTDQEVSGVFSHPAGGSVEVNWTLAMADAVKTLDLKSGQWVSLLDKDNWKNYPRAMLRSRCISEGIRAVFPGVVSGVYTEEETESFEAKHPGKTIDAVVVRPEPVIEPVHVDEPAPHVEEQDPPSVPLYHSPGAIYKQVRTQDEFVAEYNKLVNRIKMSKTLKDDAAKQDAKQKLSQANFEVLAALPEHLAMELAF
jgi:hypothetical protein